MWSLNATTRGGGVNPFSWTRGTRRWRGRPPSGPGNGPWRRRRNPRCPGPRNRREFATGRPTRRPRGGALRRHRVVSSPGKKGETMEHPGQFGGRPRHRLPHPSLHELEDPSKTRAADHDPRRGRACLRRDRQGLYRGIRRLVVRLARVQRTAPGRGGDAPTRETALLPQLRRQGLRRRHRTSPSGSSNSPRSPCPRCFSPIPGPRPSTRRSSWCGTTTTPLEGRKRRRSSRATRPITASPSRRPA